MSPLPLLMLISLGGTGTLPKIAAAGLDSVGCARLELRQGGRARPLGLPSGLCVRSAFAAHLEGQAEVNVVLLVDLPRDSQRLAAFVYRLRGSHLAPRFLGSGFSSLRLAGARRLPSEPLDCLGLEVIDEVGALSTLTCSFVGFPLTCEVDRSPPARRGVAPPRAGSLLEPSPQ